MTSTSEANKTTFYHNDSITATISGETDGGLTITTSLEMDGDAAGLAGDFDSQSIKIASDSMGTITFAGHGGSTVMGGWDDMMPTAYEEAFALTKSNAATPVANSVIAGFGGNNLWRYDSPTYSGVSFHASYQSANSTTANNTTTSSYSDMGIQIAPEMVDGLTIGYAVGEHDESATVLGLDSSTMWVKYAYGSVTVGYQVSEVDGPTATQDDDSTSYAISYAVTDDLSVSYGEHTLDLGSATAAGTDQESKGFSASYVMGGTTIKAAFNETDNIAGSATADEESMEIALSFAF
jgi:outer membrane protein OmpU